MQMFAGPNEWPRTKSEAAAAAAAAGNCCNSPSSTLSTLPLSLCLHPTGQSTAVGHCTRHPATGNRHWESLMSLWAFLIRVCICVCQMLSVEQRQRLAPQLHVQHAHRPPPYTVSLPPSLLRQCQSQPLAVQWTPMVQWAIVVIDEPTLSVAYS